MGDLLYRARTKCAAYSHLLDLKKKLQDLQTEVPSIRRNYRYWELNNQISIAYLQWYSIKLPPFAFSQVNRVVNTEATKKEGFIDESTPELSQVITPISIPDATSDLTLDSDSISGAKTDDSTLRSTSTIEDSANSIGDFVVSQPEEIESVPTDVDDEDDYIDSELIPQFFFVETEADDDCLEFELLIPSFFFKEEEDLPDEVNFQTIKVLSNAGSYEKLPDLKEFVSGDNKVIRWTRFALLHDYTRLLFDRGKESDTSIQGFPNHVGESIVHMLDLLFAKLPANEAWNLQGVGTEFLLQLKMGRVYDRGKVMELLQRYSKLSVELKLLDAYCRRFVLELLCRHLYQFQLLFMKASGPIILETTDNGYTSKLFARWIYDRGRCTVPSWIFYEKLIVRLLPNLGYESHFWLIHGMALVCVVDHSKTEDASKLFIDLTASDSLLKGTGHVLSVMCYSWSAIFTIKTRNVDTHPFNTSVIPSHSPKVLFYCKFLGIECLHISFAYTRKLFDRGKAFELSMWDSCFVQWEFEFGFVYDMCLNLVDNAHRGLVHELIYKLRYRSASIIYLSVLSEVEIFFLVLKGNLLECAVNSTILLVWTVQAKTCRFLFYYYCDVFNLMTKSVKPLPFNIFTVYSHGFCPVHFPASVHQFSQLWPDGDVCSYRLSTQLLHVWNSEGDLVESLSSFQYRFMSTRSLACYWFYHDGVLSGIQVLLVVSQMLNVLFWVGYLKWKFQLLSTDLRSVRNVRLMDNTFIYVGILFISWNYKDNWLCNKTAATLGRSNMFLLSLGSTGNTSGTIWFFIELPEIPVCMGCGRFIFDRGKPIFTVVMTPYQQHTFGLQAPIYLPGECHCLSEVLTWRMNIQVRHTGFSNMLILVITSRWDVAINYDAHLDDVPKHITGPENSLPRPSLRTFLTEFFAPTILVIIIHTLRTCAEVLVQLTDILSHISGVACKEDDQNTHAIAEDKDLFFCFLNVEAGNSQAAKCKGTSEHIYFWEPSTYKFSSMIEFMGDTTTLCDHFTLPIISQWIARLGVQVLQSLTGMIMGILATDLLMLVGGNYYCWA